MRLDGKRALVTGASSGIGMACAVALAEYGADVVLAARRINRLNELAQAMRKEKWNACPVELDVADVRAVERVVNQQGPFDILVNSAGLARHGKALETRLEDFDTVMAVNLRGAYFLTQIVARNLIAAGRAGSLITISSQMGHVGGIDRAVYCASKFAVEGFTKAMALEFGPFKIRVNTICPGNVLTPMLEQTGQAIEQRDGLAAGSWLQKRSEDIPLGRLGLPEDIANVVSFFCSADADYVTGQSLHVNGGIYQY